jgi:lipid A ethanolaminephosphotransferase
MPLKIKLKLSATPLALISALFITLVCNGPLWTFLAHEQGVGFAARCMLIIVAFYSLVLALFALPRIQKPLIATLLLVSATASYFISKYGILIDSEMVRNALQTDHAETRDLLGSSFLLWMVTFFVMPTSLLWLTEITYPTYNWQTAFRHLQMPMLCLVVLLGTAWSGMQELAPFYRNHREVRHMIVPFNVIAAAVKYTRTDLLPASQQQPHFASFSSQMPRAEGMPRRVVVFVVGETARAANFSLGGYQRQTNPVLARRDDIVYFEQFTSCGTATAFSLPCMFSSLGRSDFSLDKFAQHDDLMALIANAGVNTLWVDNNSGCKGVCSGHEIIREVGLAKAYPDQCPKGECYDGALVDALKTALKRKGDLFIVLHQKGSHGPLYYKRTPEAFAKFQPVCRQADLGKCTQEQIINAYDNSIAYTDHVLNSLIETLAGERSASLLYSSDHGESLGEKGMYLHGAPYIIAPSEQTHIPAVLWMSKGATSELQIDSACMQAQAQTSFSHDNLFSTLLQLNQIQTPAFKASDSMLGDCTKKQSVSLMK